MLWGTHMPASIRFSQKFLETYNPKSDRDEIFDREGNGLGIRVTAKAKTFFFVRRVKGQKTRFTLGRYPAMSLAQARVKANELLDRINKGEDLRADMAARKQAEA